jgi:hypothetical protein
MTDAKALVSAFADALERRDWPAFTALLDPDVVYEGPYAPSSSRGQARASRRRRRSKDLGQDSQERDRPEHQVDGRSRDHEATFEGPARFQYELDDEGKISTNADGTTSVAWWLRDDTGEWKQWMTNRFARLKA